MIELFSSQVGRIVNLSLRGRVDNSFYQFLLPLALGLAGLLLSPGTTRADPPVSVVVGSKSFTESVILGELVRILAEDAGASCRHRRRLGDTSKTWVSLLTGRLDVYCEYTGTLTQEILAGENIQDPAHLARVLEGYGLRASRSLGFRNNYALGMKEGRAEALHIRTISDLCRHPDLRLGLSHAFLERADGWRGLQKHYGLPFDTPRGLEHSLAYRGLETGLLDVVDLYTTDAEIRRYGIRVLEDDKNFFPAYEAILLYRADLETRAPEVVQSLLRLEGQISAATMQDLNARANIDRQSETRVAADFLAESLNIHTEVAEETMGQLLLRTTGEHLLLVVVSLALAIPTAIPLGVIAARAPTVGQLILGLVGILQTFPALALLTFLIVLFGVGPLPAIVALFAYSLLPIVRNTYAGLHDIPLQIRESAEALGLSSWARLYLIELPMASRSILAGIKTAAVINVGFATLGGLIGAGGYGQTIMTGLDKSDTGLLLEGAIPAVLMALAVQGLFDLAERVLVPRGLRLKPSE
jgi:osmoprotectant transport system permease protein